jgi:hypothetical protein
MHITVSYEDQGGSLDNGHYEFMTILIMNFIDIRKKNTEKYFYVYLFQTDILNSS